VPAADQFQTAGTEQAILASAAACCGGSVTWLDRARRPTMPTWIW